jgi:light-regulated signal transduction histidine kinase (bacteriophytochrome)
MFLSLKIFSQDTAVKYLYLDSLPLQGVLLEKGCKFHEGDNPNWAQPEYTDSAWQSINTLFPLYKLPQTGLGLSLSYNIVKAHGGEIKVETREAEGSDFIIQLPAKGIES